MTEEQKKALLGEFAAVRDDWEDPDLSFWQFIADRSTMTLEAKREMFDYYYYKMYEHACEFCGISAFEIGETYMLPVTIPF